MHEIDGEILFSAMTDSFALLFYIKDNNRLMNLDSSSYSENISYVLRYYSLMDLNACSKNNSMGVELIRNIDYDFQDEFYIRPAIIKPDLFQEMLIGNSSMITLMDVEENIVVYAKLYDTAIFRSLLRKPDRWDEDIAIRYSGDLHKRNSQQTIGLKILHKNYRGHKQVLAVYMRYYFQS